MSNHSIELIESSGLTATYGVRGQDTGEASPSVKVSNGGDFSHPMGQGTTLEVSTGASSTLELVIRPPIRDQDKLITAIGNFVTFAQSQQD